MEERRKMHECLHEQTIGRFKEFMEITKGFRMTLTTIAFAIVIQVGTFLYLWGGLTKTVEYHETTINKILAKLDKVTVVYAQGERGEKGEKGDSYKPSN